MNILFSFECSWMPIRAKTLINFLKKRGHVIDILTTADTFDGKADIRFNANYKNINDVNLEIYDLWIHDLLNYEKISEKSDFNYYINKFKNKFGIVNYDDGCEFFDYRLENLSKVDIWVNNILYRNRKKYNNYIANKCMLVPSYIEDSNSHNKILEKNKSFVPFSNKKDRVYFTGTLTGGFPCYEHRSNIISEVDKLEIEKLIRVHGSENHVVLKWFYDHIISTQYKKEMVNYDAFINEINNSKFVLCLKGNGTDPTRRYFESLSFNCLSFVTENNYTEHLIECEGNKHYINIKLDASDINSKIEYYNNNTHEAKRIADAGYNFWNENYRIFEDGSLSIHMENYIIDNFNKIASIKL